MSQITFKHSTIHRFAGQFLRNPGFQKAWQYAVVLMFYIGLFFLVSFFSKAMPGFDKVTQVKSATAGSPR
ncbi:MAG: hypothetical protein ACKO1U_02850 [Bacteroidota bacterium]